MTKAIAALLLLPLALAATHSEAEIPAASPADLEVLVQPLAMACVACSSCGTNKHKTEASPKGTAGGEIHACHSGDCLFEHGVCGGLAVNTDGPSEVVFDAQLLGAIRTALQHGDSRQLAALIAESNQQIRFNADRHAVQLIGCADQVIVHIPVALAFSDELHQLLED